MRVFTSSGSPRFGGELRSCLLGLCAAALNGTALFAQTAPGHEVSRTATRGAICIESEMALSDWISARSELGEMDIVHSDILDENAGTFTDPDLDFPNYDSADRWAADVLVAAVIDARGRAVFSEVQRVRARLLEWGPQGEHPLSDLQLSERLDSFATEALETFATMRFYPGTLDGERVTSVVCQPFRFVNSSSDR